MRGRALRRGPLLYKQLRTIVSCSGVVEVLRNFSKHGSSLQGVQTQAAAGTDSQAEGCLQITVLQRDRNQLNSKIHALAVQVFSLKLRCLLA